jgi:hypothetical protein
MIAGDNDTRDKFFARIIDNGEHLSPVTMTLVINLLLASTILVNKKVLEALSLVSTTPPKTVHWCQ